ncbi:MAG: tetratricopeptide repeat-containing sensor histidine kinase [Bacteroidales bacterium]|nr:tetratricopeptide repeat-containing sensor histidine kinase [Bacteroidales bacterium]
MKNHKNIVLAIVVLCLSFCLKAQDVDSLRVKILQCFNESRFVEVIDYTKQALQLYEQADDKYNVAGCYNTIAGAYMRLGQYDEAIRNYDICTGIMDEIGGERAAVNKRYIMNNIASIYFDMEEYDQSEEMYLKCIELLGDTGTDTIANRDLATYYQNLSGVKLMKGEIADAVSFAEQALALSQRYNDWQEKIINRRIALAKAYHEAGRHDESDAELEAALTIARREKEIYFETPIFMLYGQFAYENGDYNTAEQHYLTALRIAKENHFNQFYLECLQGAYLATKTSHPERAIGYFEESVKMRDSIYNEDQQALIRDYQVKYQMSEKEHELELQQEKARQSSRLLSLSLLAVVLLLILVVVLVWNAIQRKKRNEKLARLNHTKDQLFTVVSHDIKTPVLAQEKSIDIICEHINDIPLNYLKDYLFALKSSTKELKAKIINVISWVKGVIGDTVNQTEPFNLSRMADKVIHSQAFEIGQKSLIVTNAIPEEWMGNDDIQIVEMVLQNLLSNAVKYSFANGEIRLEAEEGGERYLLKVIDHGQGIEKERLGKLLKRMTSSTEGVDGESGTGIGLFVSRQILERNGGIIEIESEEGVGTTVTMSIRKGEQ